MEAGQARSLNLLGTLLGRWCGSGIAEFPTIPSFEYREELVFTANDVQPLLHYEQRTWKKLEAGEYVPSHWESGFWRVLSTTDIELLCAQAGGRVEVLRGTLEPTRDGFVLHLFSTLVANDARMDKTAREFVLRGSMFRYTLQMSTVNVSDLTLHTHAELRRGNEYVAGDQA